VTQLASGKPDDALGEARRLQRERPDAPIGYALEGEVYAAQKKFPEAIAAMQKALAKQPSTNFAARIYTMLGNSSKSADAAAFANRWIKDHPKDAMFRTAVGQHKQAIGDAAGAIAEYRAALDADADNITALNNLAWMLGEQGKPEAHDFAERAYRMSPLNPNVINTYGWVLLKQDPKRGLALLRMASALAPNDPQLRLILARGLAQTGDKAGARRELELVAKRNTPAKAEAEKMLREL
jgi:predicted Zn-dependent protease